MKPQWFEELILTDEPLSAEQRKELEARMQAYPELAVLQKNWEVLKHHLESAEMAAPQPGFTQRWLTRWEVEAARITRRRALLTAGLCSVGALALLAVIVGPSLPSLVEVKEGVFLGLTSTIEWFAFVQVVVRVAGSLLVKMPPAVWSAIASLILVLPLGWAALFRQVAFTKGTVQ
jgi:hypothetical protein